MKSRLTNEDNSHFISLSDMMSVLMMIFMLISLISMRSSIKKNEVVKEVAITYQTTQQELYEDLYKEFAKDLKRWDASIDRNTISISFNSPDILFDKGKSDLKERFENILSDFFPRYISIIEDKYKDDVEEIRIEGYTDSDGLRGKTKRQNYFYNMELSQDRTRNVLEYCMGLDYVKDKFNWLTERITANGLSFSHLKYTRLGREDKTASRRVEFRVKTNSETKIRKIIETLE